jgi:hypothetical protein
MTLPQCQGFFYRNVLARKIKSLKFTVEVGNDGESF